MGELSRPFEAVPARHVLHDALHPIMGSFRFQRAVPLSSLNSRPQVAQRKAWSGAGVVPLPVTDVPEIRLANSWTGGVEAAKIVE